MEHKRLDQKIEEARELFQMLESNGSRDFGEIFRRSFQIKEQLARN